MMKCPVYICITSTLFLILCGCSSSYDADLHICKHHCKRNSTLDCLELNSTAEGRCCVQKEGNDTHITGVDLSHCDIHDVEKNLTDLPYLVTVYLQGNPLKNITREDLYNTMHIDLLILPLSCGCPGGSAAWTRQEKENKTQTTNCSGEVNTCQVANVTCPNSQSECQHVGPNLMECVCIDGYHGYKCLKSGKFPTTVFMIGLGVCTVVVSAVLWLLETRCKKSPQGL